MKKLFTLLVVVLISLLWRGAGGEAFAQTKQPEPKFDSLLVVNTNYKTPDIKKLQLLNLLAKGYSKINPDKGIETADLALSLARKLHNELEQAAALHYKAENIIAKGDAKQALVPYEEAMAINRKCKNEYGISENLKSIGWCYYNLSDYKKTLEYYNKALAICERQQNKIGIAGNLGNIGLVYSDLSDYAQALEYHQKALALHEQLGKKSGMAANLSNIGLVYSGLSDYRKALEYYQKALHINEQLGNKNYMSANITNIGIIHFQLADYPKALEYFQKALSIDEQLGGNGGLAGDFSNVGMVYAKLSDNSKALEYFQKGLNISKQLGNKGGEATFIGNIGLVYSYLADYSKALEYHQEALSINEQLGNKKSIAINLANIGDIYRNAPDSLLVRLGLRLKPGQRFDKALDYGKRSLQMAKEIGDIYLQENAWKSISIAYEKQGNSGKAFQAYKNFISLRDSIASTETKNTIQKKEMQYAFDKKEAEFKFRQQLSSEQLEKQKQEIAAKNAQRNLFIAGTVLMLLLAGSVFIGLKRTQQQKKISEALRVQSDDLLHNILPVEIAGELKANGHAEARQFDDVSVLFTDFVHFTQTAEKLSPKELVQALHECFTAFDEIIERNGLEKIKTIGDAYMAVCGLPNADKKHAQHTVMAAIEIRDFMKTRQQLMANRQQLTFDIRLGIHSGSVIAGIVGVKKFAYDIWGDTVNMAARMEQSGEAGKVNISETTYELVKDRFACIHRGKIQAKNKGEVDMYFVEKNKEI